MRANPRAGKLRRERCRIGLGRGRHATEGRDLRRDPPESALEFLDPRGKSALNGGEPFAGRRDCVIDRGAGLPEVVDDLRQFVAKTVARSGQCADRGFGAFGDGVA